jgi:hypothetical protein
VIEVIGTAMRHDDALLTFVDRLARDSEFREWFVHSPGEALRSYGLAERDLRYLEGALAWETNHREVAAALSPFVKLLVDAAEHRPQEPDAVYARLTRELGELRGRIAEAQSRERAARPWWKFWLW